MLQAALNKFAFLFLSSMVIIATGMLIKGKFIYDILEYRWSKVKHHKARKWLFISFFVFLLAAITLLQSTLLEHPYGLCLLFLYPLFQIYSNHHHVH